MSVTMAKTDGVTVFTLTSDPQSSCPALCQVLKAICYNPLCCSVSQHLRRVQRSSQSVLGVLHFMVGFLNMGLGMILPGDIGIWWGRMQRTGYPFWLGAVFILFGIVSILSEKYPSPCLVIVNVILNLAGVGFAITAIVLYSIDIADMKIESRCNYSDDYGYVYTSQYNRPTRSPQEELMREKCLEGNRMALMFLRSINAVLIVLSVLELCVTISSVIMGIKTLRSREKRDNKSTDDPEHYKTLLEDVTSNPTV